MNRLYSLFRSLAFSLSCQTKKREYDILFYYPAYFNREKEKENPFFKPFYRLCRRYNLSYIVLEEPVLLKKHARNSEATPFDLPFYTVLLFRKLLPLTMFDSFQHRDWFIAKLLRPIFLRNLRFKNYIVLSNSMHGFFRGLEPDANLYDYQHGIIFSKHQGYLKQDGTTQDHIELNRVNLLLYGEGFKRAIVKSNIDGYYEKHTHIIGSPKHIVSSVKSMKTKNILFSLQFTGDGEFSDHEPDWRDFILSLLTDNRKFFESNGLQIIFKHHPRFDNSIDLSEIESFSFVTFSSQNISDLLDNSFLHITFYSTSIFDASAKGVPTIAWQHEYSLAHIFTEDFDYPLGVTKEEKITDIINNYLENDELYMQDSKRVLEWYKTIYAPFDENLFKTLFVKKSVCKPVKKITTGQTLVKKGFNTIIDSSYRLGINRLFYNINPQRQIILTYHNIIPDELFDDSLHLGVSHTLSVFDAQIEHIKKHFTFTTEPGVPNSCIITFDDGFMNNYEIALPILQKHNIKAIFFIPLKSLLENETLWIDKLLMWLSYAPSDCYDLPFFRLCFDDQESRRACFGALMKQLWEDYTKKEKLLEYLEKEIDFNSLPIDERLYRLRFTPMRIEHIERLKELGHKVGCHSYSHENLSLMDTKALNEEISSSEKYIGSIFNTDIYSYPFGGPEEVSADIIETIEKSAFSYGVANINHKTSSILFGRYALPRLTLPNSSDPAMLDAALSGLEHFVRHKCSMPDIRRLI